MYHDLFERNYGIFTQAEQEKIRKGRAAIIGLGGIGGIVAIELARSGVENMIFYEHDIYTDSNMNRQVGCFSDTLNKNKAQEIADEIARINPDCHIELHARAFELSEMEELTGRSDVIMPAADDWPLSMTILAKAKDFGKPAILAYPVGAQCRVSTFLPSSPYAQECMVIPRNLPYAELEKFMSAPNNRAIMHYYMTKGGWTRKWFDGWVAGEKPHAQMCPIVWIASSLAAMEIIKLLSGKWKPVVAPRYWEVTPDGAKIAKFSASRRILAHHIQKPGAEKMIAWFAARPKLVEIFTRAISR